MLSHSLIQKILMESSLSENEITKRIFLPCFQKISAIMGHSMRNIRYVGGTSELGNDIEFYEVIGPDRIQIHTGIQFKKKDINQTDANILTNQGNLAFEKNLIDPATGQTHRIGRWIVATTGEIKDTAKNLIQTQLSRHGKMISFWDGQRLAEFIMNHYYEEFVAELGIEKRIADSSNVINHIFDPASPIELAGRIEPNEWVDIDLSAAIPGICEDAIFLAFHPLDENNIPSLKVAVKTTVDDLIIDSMMSQLNLTMVRLSMGETRCKIKTMDNRAIRVLARGYRFLR